MVKELKNGQKIVGVKQLRKGLKDNTLRAVFLTCDGDPGLTEPLEKLATTAGVPVYWVDTMSQLGHACGIDVGASSAALLK